MSKIEFKSQVIHFDKSKEQTKIGNAKIAAEKINEILDEVDSFLKIKPTKEKRERLLKDGYGYVLDELRSGFPFPNATDEFNFNAMGIDPSPLAHLLDGLNRRVSEHMLHLDGTKVAVTEKSLEEIKEDCTIRSKSEEENRKFEFAKKLCDFLNDNNEDLQKYCQVIRSKYSGQRSGMTLFNNFVLVSGHNDDNLTYVPRPPRV